MIVTHHGQNIVEKYLSVHPKANACSIAFSTPYNMFSECKIRCVFLLDLVKEMCPFTGPCLVSANNWPVTSSPRGEGPRAEYSEYSGEPHNEIGESDKEEAKI